MFKLSSCFYVQSPSPVENEAQDLKDGKYTKQHARQVQIYHYCCCTHGGGGGRSHTNTPLGLKNWFHLLAANKACERVRKLKGKRLHLEATRHRTKKNNSQRCAASTRSVHSSSPRKLPAKALCVTRTTTRHTTLTAAMLSNLNKRICKRLYVSGNTHSRTYNRTVVLISPSSRHVQNRAIIQYRRPGVYPSIAPLIAQQGSSSHFTANKRTRVATHHLTGPSMHRLPACLLSLFYPQPALSRQKNS